MRSSAALVLTAFVLIVAAPGAQDSAPDQRPTFKASTRLVQVSVAVRDGRNRPIDGLTAADFQILEDGEEVPISLFAAASERAVSAPAMAAQQEKGRFTNRIQSPTGGGVVAIMVDQLNTSFTDQAYARQHLIRFLRTIRPDDRVALYVLTATGMRVLYDFTRDADSLLRALERLDRGDPAGAIGADQDLPPMLLQGLSAFARGALDRMEAHYAWVRGMTTLEALESVAAHLAGVPGRKNVVWISAGFPFYIHDGLSGTSFSNLRSETQRSARALNQSDTAVYPVDARGILAQSADPSAPGRVPSLGEVMAPIDGMRTVADWTGGRAFYNSNDIGRAITRAVDDSRQTYLLGYYPSNRTWDGRFRNIKVKVRRPGAEVRHRQGYFALPPDPPANPRAALAAAVINPLESTAIPIDVAVSPQASAVTLSIRLDPAALALGSGNGRWSGEVDVAIAQLLESREFVREKDETLPISVSDGERMQLLEDGVRLSRTIDLRPDARQVRIVVRDTITGATGSVFIDADRLRERPDRSMTTSAAGER